MNASHIERTSTTWAALTLKAKGCALHAVDGGWDIEFPNGEWRAANDWRELCTVAEEAQRLFR